MGPVRLAAAAAVLLLARPAAGAGDSRAPSHAAAGEVTLEGERVAVRWTDGDSFRILDGRWRGRNTRLEGYNTLEAFGPVHRWGGWTRDGLYAIAAASAGLAAREAWACRTGGRPDRYGRLLVRCPGAAEALVRAGHAMVYAVDAAADPALLDAQRDAQRRGAGMWASGVPAEIVTSVHSADEPDLGPGGAYDRLADTRTGLTRTLRHDRVYGTCQEVCHGRGEDRSCMVYVPFARRYRDRPACLRAGLAP
ncbi:MAG TPA: thermonuclease family protein [Anaeromyxobacteraceae bacterium]|nr:thermonuclease family protein [Anaeromyxobacteraceae bacterium]